MKTIRIGNGCGFWGDNLDAPRRLAETGRIHVLTLEYLAELTMSILAIQKARDPALGYATDFLDALTSLVPILRAQPKLKIITNAGGMNPRSCAARAQEILTREGVARRIAIVTGDDLMPMLPRLIEAGQSLSNMETGEQLETIQDRIVSANAYLGAAPIAQALANGADIVITGRVADASLTVAPIVESFGWHFDEADADRLAIATVAGHLIECGAQVTGGLWIHANDQTHLETVGYPIVEVSDDGQFVITKPENSGGVVNRETVSEQLLYEVADPARYYTPDVIADFTAVELEEIGPDRVAVRGGRAQGITTHYKVSAAYRDGYTAAGTLVIAGPEAIKKARWSAHILLDRLKQIGLVYQQSCIEVLGAGDAIRVNLRPSDPPEVVLRVAVKDPRRAAVERFTKEFAPLVTSGFAGTTGYTTGRPQVREVFAYWPALIAKSTVSPQVELLS